MLEAKLWHSKTETNNVKVAKMVNFIKTCDQYPRRFNFVNFCYSIILPSLSAGEKYIFRKCCSGGMSNFLLPGGNYKNLGESWLGAWVKWRDSIFWLTSIFVQPRWNIQVKEKIQERFWRGKPLRNPQKIKGVSLTRNNPKEISVR